MWNRHSRTRSPTCLHLALGVLAASLLWVSCTPKPSPHLPARPHEELILLLRDLDTDVVGAANVKTASGAVALDTERSVARVVAGGRIETDRLSDDEVDQLFGAALSALPPPPQRFTLHFRFESDQLTDASSALVPHILAVVRERPVPEVAVVGHTDRAGARPANFTLGLSRAYAVRDLLIDAGVSTTLIETRSLGEELPAVPTADGVPDVRNRRVEVSIR